MSAIKKKQPRSTILLIDEVGRKQEAIMFGYISQNFVKDNGERQKLHMFFSPWQVPTGLSREQVKLCIQLSELRREYTYNRPPQLLELLRVKKNKAKFNRLFLDGIEKLLFDISIGIRLNQVGKKRF